MHACTHTNIHTHAHTHTHTQERDKQSWYGFEKLKNFKKEQTKKSPPHHRQRERHETCLPSDEHLPFWQSERLHSVNTPKNIPGQDALAAQSTLLQQAI